MTSARAQWASQPTPHQQRLAADGVPVGGVTAGQAIEVNGRPHEVAEVARVTEQSGLESVQMTFAGGGPLYTCETTTVPVLLAPVPDGTVDDIAVGCEVYHRGRWRTVLAVEPPPDDRPWDTTRVTIEGRTGDDAGDTAASACGNHSRLHLWPTTPVAVRTT